MGKEGMAPKSLRRLEGASISAWNYTTRVSRYAYFVSARVALSCVFNWISALIFFLRPCVIHSMHIAKTSLLLLERESGKES